MAKYAACALLLPAAVLAASGDDQDGLFSSYVSLSFELIGFPDWAGTRAQPNEYSANMINNLVNIQGSPMIVRVGGNSADRAIYDKTLTTSTSRGCPNADKGAWQCIGTSFFDSYGAFPAGTLYSHNFNLATWNSSGFDTLRDTVPLACNALRGQLEVFEIGNEPDLFIPLRRPNTYSVADYVDEWRNETTRFEKYLADACPDMAENIKYMFPSVSSPGARLHIPDIFKEGGDSLDKVTQVSAHNYMDGATNPGVTLQKTLMNHTAVVRSIGGHVKYAKSYTAPNPDAKYIIGEHNSLYGGGAVGLSDVYGAALWGLDFSLYAASTQIIKRVHFHQSIGSPYADWAPTEPRQTKAPYYGKLAAATFLAHSDKIQVKTLAIGPRDDVDSGYAAYKGDKLRRVALINLREYDSGSSAQRGSQTYTVDVPPRSRWVAQRLTAPGARDKTGITYNGYAYEAESLGKPVRVQGLETDRVVTPDKNGKLSIEVADSEAVILVRSC